VLADCHASDALSTAEEQELYQQIENLYSVEPELRTLGVLVNTLPRTLSLKLQKWTAGGQFGFLFDNVDDTVTFSRFQCFDFQGMQQCPRFSNPSLVYPASSQPVITNRDISHVFKAFLIDEAWFFFKNSRIRAYH
jgi:type IV secretion system protein VirB4